MRFLFCCTIFCFTIVLSFLGTAFSQDTNFSTGPQYLMNFGSPLFARPISTPSMTLSGPSLEIGADNASGVLIAGAENQTALPSLAVAQPKIDLFPTYYGVTAVSVIEVSFAEDVGASGNQLPGSISDNGVFGETTAQALRERGYGVSLVEAAAYQKAHAGHPARVYTNDDIERMHGGN